MSSKRASWLVKVDKQTMASEFTFAENHFSLSRDQSFCLSVCLI